MTVRNTSFVSLSRAKRLRSGLRALAIGPCKHREMVRGLNEMKPHREDFRSAAVHKRYLLLTPRLTKASVISLNCGRETWTIKIRVALIQAPAWLGAPLVVQWLGRRGWNSIGRAGRRHRDWRPFRGSNWCSKKADYKSATTEGEGGVCFAKKEEPNDEKAIDKTKS
jgi:hypothetical protein